MRITFNPYYDFSHIDQYFNEILEIDYIHNSSYACIHLYGNICPNEFYLTDIMLLLGVIELRSQGEDSSQ